MSKKRKKPYKGYFDIEHMVAECEEKHIAFAIAVSEDKYRGAGKTYSAAKALYKRYLERQERFVLFVREVKELGHCAEGIFGAYLAQNYPKVTIYEKKQDNIFSIIYIQTGTGKEKKTDVLGYVTPLKNAKNLKNYRGIWETANVKKFYMDEFMPLDNKYLRINGIEETDLMKTIIDTVNGKVEDLVIIMTANCISLGNPYFSMLGLNSKIQSNTRSIKTDTVIYEKVEVEGLDERHMMSSINRAFGKNTEEYASNVWIGDNNSLVCKPDNWGRPIYICAIVYNNQTYGVYSYPNVGLYYISTSWDSTYDYTYALTLDGDLNVPLLRGNKTICRLRDWFYDGVVRVANGGIQRMLLDVFG